MAAAGDPNRSCAMPDIALLPFQPWIVSPIEKQN